MCSIVEEKKLGNWLKLKAVTLPSDVIAKTGGEKLLTQRMLAADEDMNYLKTTGDVDQLSEFFSFFNRRCISFKLFSNHIIFSG